MSAWVRAPSDAKKCFIKSIQIIDGFYKIYMGLG